GHLHSRRLAAMVTCKSRICKSEQWRLVCRSSSTMTRSSGGLYSADRQQELRLVRPPLSINIPAQGFAPNSLGSPILVSHWPITAKIQRSFGSNAPWPHIINSIHRWKNPIRWATVSNRLAKSSKQQHKTFIRQ
ncbi:hypothetical protein ACLOJK_037290, partial [Asimina triloba]